jgi:hypothetical protein
MSSPLIKPCSAPDCGPCAPPERLMRLGRFLSARVAMATDRCFLLHYCGNPIRHETIVSTQGESYLNWMETHFNIQRRLYDDQFSLARTPAELEQRHQAFIQTDNTTAHQGLLKDRRLPPIPVEVLGTAHGRRYTPEELARHFSQAVFPRTTNQYECVTLHRYHFYVEAG